MVGWHHRLNGREFEQFLGESEGRGSLASAVHGVGALATEQDWEELTSPTYSSSEQGLGRVRPRGTCDKAKCLRPGPADGNQEKSPHS